jgi:hypothetical protein
MHPDPRKTKTTCVCCLCFPSVLPDLESLTVSSMGTSQGEIREDHPRPRCQDDPGQKFVRTFHLSACYFPVATPAPYVATSSRHHSLLHPALWVSISELCTPKTDQGWSLSFASTSRPVGVCRVWIWTFKTNTIGEIWMLKTDRSWTFSGDTSVLGLTATVCFFSFEHLKDFWWSFLCYVHLNIIGFHFLYLCIFDCIHLVVGTFADGLAVPWTRYMKEIAEIVPARIWCNYYFQTFNRCMVVTSVLTSIALLFSCICRQQKINSVMLLRQ